MPDLWMKSKNIKCYLSRIVGCFHLLFLHLTANQALIQHFIQQIFLHLTANHLTFWANNPSFKQALHLKFW